MLKAGDQVITTKEFEGCPSGIIGRILFESCGDYGVVFRDEVMGIGEYENYTNILHNLGGILEDDRGYFIPGRCLKKISPGKESYINNLCKKNSI